MDDGRSYILYVFLCGYRQWGLWYIMQNLGARWAVKTRAAELLDCLAGQHVPATLAQPYALLALNQLLAGQQLEGRTKKEKHRFARSISGVAGVWFEEGKPRSNCLLSVSW